MDKILYNSGVNSGGSQAPVRQNLMSGNAAVTLDAKGNGINVDTDTSSSIGYLGLESKVGELLGYTVLVGTEDEFTDAAAEAKFIDGQVDVMFGYIGDTLSIRRDKGINDIYVIGLGAGVGSDSNTIFVEDLTDARSFWSKYECACETLNIQCTAAYSGTNGANTKARLLLSGYGAI